MLEAKTHIIENKELFERLKAYVEKTNPELVFIDVETDSEIEKTAKLYGIGICFNDKYAFYIPWRDIKGNLWWESEDIKEITEWLYNTVKPRKLINHNIIYDVLVLENELGVNLTDYIYSDTILQHHTLKEEPPHGLKEIALEILGPWANKAQKEMKESVIRNGGKFNETTKEMYKCDTDILANYCMWDVLLTYKLFVMFEEQLKQEKLDTLFYKEEIMPLYKEVTINMKRKGFPVDIPYFEQLKKELRKELRNMEALILDDLKEKTDPFVQNLLDKEFPVKAAGLFPKFIAEKYKVPIPQVKRKEKDGTHYMADTISVVALKKQQELTPEYSWYYDWIISKGTLVPNQVTESSREIQETLYFKKYPKKKTKYIFNLSSPAHIGQLLYNILNIECKHFTDGGKSGIPKPSTKSEVLDEIIEIYSRDFPFLSKLMDYRKLNKLQSTYVLGILNRQIDGYIFASMLQFGTTSGRFASRNPNLQNQPRIKDEEAGLSELVLKYTNAIRRGFKAPKGYKVVNADYSQLEPCCFAHMSGDEKLREIFRKGYDLYSQVAIDVFKLENVSANKKDKNYLKNVSPEFRQKSKIFCLAVVYGAGANRIAEAMGVTWQEANEVINAYLSAYPNLKKYMWKCDYNAITNGAVYTEFGRVRHIPRAKELHEKYGKNLQNYKWAKEHNLAKERYELRNLLNNAKNFPIQGLAGHIVNRSLISTSKKFRENNIDGWIGLTVHDENVCVVKEDQAEFAAKLLQEAMEQTTIISVPLKAEPLIAENWADAK